MRPLWGVTAIAPATMTLPVEELERILATAAEYRRDTSRGRGPGGDQHGGPFISEAKKGAQDARNIIRCDAEVCRRFLEASEGLVKFVGIAPECNPEAVDFIREMKG